MTPKEINDLNYPADLWRRILDSPEPMNRDDISEYQPTPKQEQALREYLHEAVVPLIEDVLVKKLGQAMAYLKEQQQPEQEPVTAHQALEALDELESCARGDEPFNHFAAPLVRQFIEQAVVLPKQWVGLTDAEAKKTFEEHNCVISADLAGILARAIQYKLEEKNND